MDRAIRFFMANAGLCKTRISLLECNEISNNFIYVYFIPQAKEEEKDMDSLQRSNKRILFNLLPAHVATHFLDNQFKNNMVSAFWK